MPEVSLKKIEQAMHTYIPARMEIVEKDGKTIIMDGAHNPQKLHALVESLQAKFPDKKMAVLMGLLSGKDLNLHDVIREIKPVAASLIATSFSAEQDMPRGSIEPQEIVRVSKENGFETILWVAKTSHQRLHAI